MASNKKDNNDDDLYGDLDFSFLPPKKKKPPPEYHNNTKQSVGDSRRHRYPTNGDDDRVAALERANRDLTERLRRLQEEHDVLKRNMGTLYRTAKNEIRRKDDRIDRLQQQVDEYECQKSNSHNNS